jgi:PAS domain-containing protein
VIQLCEATRVKWELARDKEAQMEAVEAERSRLQQITDQANASITVTDRDGRYQFFNQPFLRLFADDQIEVLGKTIAELFPEQAEHLTSAEAVAWETGLVERKRWTRAIRIGVSSPVVSLCRLQMERPRACAPSSTISPR